MPAPCPKHMEYGPCGGVLADGRCEAGDRPCPFVDRPVVAWHGIRGLADPVRPPPTAAATALRARLGAGPVVVADLPGRPLDPDSIRAVGAVLAGHVDLVLTGDANHARVQLPPAFRAGLVRSAGLEVWAGLTCRDRNRVALEAELAALALAGVGAVHCVTGDLPASGHRADATGVFDLDATELAALAAAAGLVVSVAASPAAPPVALRAPQTVQKLVAGAEVVFVDHCGGADAAVRFRDAVRALGGSARFVGCVPLVTDAASARTLQAFPGLVLPDGFLTAILDAADPLVAGIEAAVAMAAAMLDAGFDGVDLSGGPGPAGEVAYAEAIAAAADRLR